jgi:hypothetical protein
VTGTTCVKGISMSQAKRVLVCSQSTGKFLPKIMKKEKHHV